MSKGIPLTIDLRSLYIEVEDEGWWNDDHDIYTWPITVNGWGARIECHGSTPGLAKALAETVAKGLRSV